MATSKSEHMARIRGKNTRPEVVLRRALWSRGHRYRLHSRLPGRPDLEFRRARVAVMVDGCFWHACPLHFRRPPSNRGYWDKKIARNVERDREVDRSLKTMGWRVLRFWEHEILQDVEAVAERIAMHLAEGPSLSSGENLHAS